MSSKYGVMFVGLCGHLSTTAMAGAMAVAKKLCPPLGMISETEKFRSISFADLSDCVFGGWDIRSCSDSRKALKDIGFDDIDQLIEISKNLETIQSRTFPGIILNAGEAISNISQKQHVFITEKISAAIEKVKEDIENFRFENGLEKIVVINLASTEPPIAAPDDLSSRDGIESLITENRLDCIRPSLVYAYAAITSGCAYINFTPSEGGFSQGLVELAQEYRVPVMGSDGKTGETLVKSALAPMFAMRNLEVLSWEGYNILGNMDGKILQNAENGSTKIKSKDRLLPHILGYQPHSRVSIDYVPSLGDRKTAWDFIHFQGFLNTKMTLQFTWQGCDSALASPLVLDLARFGILAMERGESGVMSHMASFFKSPFGIDEHSLEKQFRLLEDYCQMAS
ncbi:MAG: inositol-3-phosphate synthase [Desulfobacula sp.]|jgi:myo-inositol-1-phosphate synthase